jgi:hypothetical protein
MSRFKSDVTPVTTCHLSELCLDRLRCGTLTKCIILTRNLWFQEWNCNFLNFKDHLGQIIGIKSTFHPYQKSKSKCVFLIFGKKYAGFS